MIPAAERHPDDTDRATAHADAWTARALAHHANAAKPAQPWAPGVCRNCGERPIFGVFCSDPEDACRVDWERRSRRG